LACANLSLSTTDVYGYPSLTYRYSLVNPFGSFYYPSGVAFSPAGR
jgi:hypothetical protein